MYLGSLFNDFVKKSQLPYMQQSPLCCLARRHWGNINGFSGDWGSGQRLRLDPDYTAEVVDSLRESFKEQAHHPFNNTSLLSYYEVNSWWSWENSKLKYKNINQSPPVLHAQILMFPFAPRVVHLPPLPHIHEWQWQLTPVLPWSCDGHFSWPNFITFLVVP